MDNTDETGRHGQPLISLLRRRWAMMCACVLIVPVVAVAYSLVQQTQYTATATILFRVSTLGDEFFGSTYIAPNTDPNREASTNDKLASLQVVAAAVAHQLGLRPRQVLSDITVAPEGASDLVDVSATAPKARSASLLANTFSQQFIAIRRDADRSVVLTAQNEVRAQLNALPKSQQTGSQGRYLAQRAEQLRILASLQTGNAQLVQPALVPTTPSSPRVIRNGALGLIVGLLLAPLLALLADRLDRRVTVTDELELLYDRPLLGVIPRSRQLATRDRRPDETWPTGADAEAFGLLRAKLRYFNVGQDVKAIMVTSALPNEGKSTIAWYLAATAALTGSALLIEADLRRPSVATSHGISSSAGLTDVLTQSDLSWEQAVCRVDSDRSTGGEGSDTAHLDVLLAGTPPPNPAELLESRQMTNLLDEAKGKYSLVVVDSPPTALVPDTISLINRVDGILVVGRVGVVTRDAARNLQRELQGLEARILGVVANDARVADSAYASYYYRETS